MTHSIDDFVDIGLLPPHFQDDPLLPTSIKFAFVHPSFEPEDNVFIVLTPDMPHLVKKIVNAMEYSSDVDKQRDLEIGGRKINLGMIQTCYEMMEYPGHLRTTRLLKDYFDKNCNSRMRTYLAVQILSTRTEAMVDDALCNDEE